MAITFGQLQSFIAVVRTGSVTAAAHELWVTQPSVSAALAALTREVGTDLFRRTGRTIALTPAGEALAGYAGRVLGLLDEGLLAAREAGASAHRQVRIAAVTTAGEYLVPSLLRGFAAAHPDIGVALHVANREQVLRILLAREADLAVAGRPPVGAALFAEPILRNDILLVSAPGDPLADGAPVPADQLGDRTWLMREEGSGTRAMSQAYLDACGLTPRTLSLGSNGAIKQAARLGLGVSLQSAIAVEDELQQGLLAKIPLADPPSETRHWYLIRPEGPTRLSVEVFMEHVMAVAASAPDAATA